MSDVTQALASETQFLWVLFLTLFMLLCFFTVVSLCHCCFCQRHLVCEWKLFGCCCHLDVQEYRRERHDLRQLREIRQRRAELEIEHLATFTQIPGPIPDSYGYRELRRQSAIRDLTSLGFIVVTPPSHDANALEMRNQLTAQQRRDILKQLLESRTFHVECDELDVIRHGQKSDTDDNIDVEEGTNSSNTERPPPSTTVKQSYAFPLHEEPENPQKTCAICLDDFAEGELINDASKCRHVFHISCLVEWLDMHDACPCCRCTMITDTEWRFAAAHAISDTQLRTSGSSERRLSNNLPETTRVTTTTAVDVETVVAPTNELHDQEEEDTTDTARAFSMSAINVEPLVSESEEVPLR